MLTHDHPPAVSSPTSGTRASGSSALMRSTSLKPSWFISATLCSSLSVSNCGVGQGRGLAEGVWVDWDF